LSAPELSVVVPSWNGAATLRAHLPSVLTAAGAAFEVLVCDDGSDDDSPGILAREFPAARVVRRPERGGFARTANAGVAAAAGRVVVLLNNDIEVESHALVRLVTALDADPELFAVVPSIVRSRSGEEEALTRILYRRGVVATDCAGSPDRPPAYACGGAMAFRRAEFEALGGFDPLFSPFYWEDVDLSYRARKRGRTIGFVPLARVVHDHGRTIGRRFAQAEVARVYERNRLLFTWKNLGDPGLWRRHLALLPAKAAFDVAAHPAFVRGLCDALRLRRDVAARRRVERAEARIADRGLLA
jgi:GT2 family glycosyltransferase